MFGTYLAMFKGYFWVSTQGLLLVMLGGPYVVLEVEPRSAMQGKCFMPGLSIGPFTILNFLCETWCLIFSSCKISLYLKRMLLKKRKYLIMEIRKPNWCYTIKKTVFLWKSFLVKFSIILQIHHVSINPRWDKAQYVTSPDFLKKITISKGLEWLYGSICTAQSWLQLPAPPGSPEPHQEWPLVLSQE